MWQYIQTTTNSKLDKMMDSLYHKLNKNWTHSKNTNLTITITKKQ